MLLTENYTNGAKSAFAKFGGIGSALSSGLSRAVSSPVGRNALTYGGAGAGLGALSGLIAPGEGDSRLESAMSRGLAGGVGGAAGGALAGHYTNPNRGMSGATTSGDVQDFLSSASNRNNGRDRGVHPTRPGVGGVENAQRSVPVSLGGHSPVTLGGVEIPFKDGPMSSPGLNQPAGPMFDHPTKRRMGPDIRSILGNNHPELASLPDLQ